MTWAEAVSNMFHTLCFSLLMLYWMYGTITVFVAALEARAKRRAELDELEVGDGNEVG